MNRLSIWMLKALSILLIIGGAWFAIDMAERHSRSEIQTMTKAAKEAPTVDVYEGRWLNKSTKTYTASDCFDTEQVSFVVSNGEPIMIMITHQHGRMETLMADSQSTDPDDWAYWKKRARILMLAETLQQARR